MKVVCIGDFHIPSRTKKIPAWVVSAIKKEKPNVILCTGDLESQEVLDFLKTLSKVKCVQGNMDWIDLPQHELLKTKHHAIGLIHGKGINPRGSPKQLMEVAEKLNCDVLVNGHTHKLKVYERDGVLFANPGTACGLLNGNNPGTDETFIILDIDKKVKVTIFKNKEEYKWTKKNGKI